MQLLPISLISFLSAVALAQSPEWTDLPSAALVEIGEHLSTSDLGSLMSSSKSHHSTVVHRYAYMQQRLKYLIGSARESDHLRLVDLSKRIQQTQPKMFDVITKELYGQRDIVLTAMTVGNYQALQAAVNTAYTDLSRWEQFKSISEDAQLTGSKAAKLKQFLDDTEAFLPPTDSQNPVAVQAYFTQMRSVLKAQRIYTVNLEFPHGAITLAALKGDVALVRSLIEHGSFLQTGSNTKHDIISYLLGQPETPTRLDEVLAVLTNAYALQGLFFPMNDYLGYAAGKALPLFTEALIRAGADVNNNAHFLRRTPLMLASMHAGVINDRIRIVRLLLDKGADVNAKDGRKQTVLMLASGVRDGSPIVRALLDAGADANALDRNRNSVLIHACRGGSADTVRMLVEAGADVNEAGQRHQTPMFEVHGDQKREIVEVLLDAGAKIDVRDMSDFHLASDLAISHIIGKVLEERGTTVVQRVHEERAERGNLSRGQ